MTEREMLDLLQKRFGFESMNARRYVTAEHVPNRAYGAQFIADFIAVDCWRGTRPKGKAYDDRWGYPVTGVEVKVSRSDWLRELKRPEKAEAWKQYTNYWWVAVPDKDMVKWNELPKDWGLMVVQGDILKATVSAPYREAKEMPWSVTVPLLRTSVKTERKSHK